MDDCVFCGIAAGRLPSRMIYEDAYTCVFLDVAGDVDGHMLAAPKKHVQSILDCDPETLTHLMETVQRMAKHCVAHCSCEGVNLLHASGECAGQSVPHFHMHIIPRKKDDQVDAWPRLPGSKRSLDELYEILNMQKERTMK